MPGLRNAGISRCFRRQGKSWGWPRPTAGEGRRPPPSRRTPRRLTWSGCWSFRRIPSRPWCGPPAPRLPVCPGPAGPAGRRAAVLWPGLSRAALLVCPLHLGVGPINGDQADCVGRLPPGSTRRPGDHLILRLGEIDDDALVSLFDCQPKPPPVCAGFVPILARGGPCGGWAEVRRIQSLYISYTSTRNVSARQALLGGIKGRS